MLIERSSLLDLLSDGATGGGCRRNVLRAGRLVAVVLLLRSLLLTWLLLTSLLLTALLLRHQRPHGRGVERTRDPQGPRERPPALGELDARGVAVHVGTTSLQPAAEVGHALRTCHHDTDQLRLGRPGPASHTGAGRDRARSHGRVYPEPAAGGSTQAAQLRAARAAPAPPSCSSGAASLRMSMRQPVSRAARRAFWPSLPMARLSW